MQNLEVLKLIADNFPFSVTIVETYVKGRPCIYVNKEFEVKTGYKQDEVLGKNLAFLQGERTDLDTIRFMRQSFKQEEACIQDILNYKKDGTPFINRLLLLPFKLDTSYVYLGFQHDITKKNGLDYDNEQLQKVLSSEICHVVNNHLQLIIGKMLLEIKTIDDDKDLHKIVMKSSERLEEINNYILNLESLSEFEEFNYV